MNKEEQGVSVNGKLLLIVVLIAGICFFQGYEYRGKQFLSYLEAFKPLRSSDTNYQLINPLVGIESPNAFNEGLYGDVKEDLEDLVSAEKKNGLIGASIYYRNLNSSVWFGINVDEKYVPASLLKMTYVFAAYRQGEDNSTFLDKKIYFSRVLWEKTKKRPDGDNRTVLVPGRSYSVRDLVAVMLVKSDNAARDLLASIIDPEYINNVYFYLGAREPSAADNFEISVKDYALFFRMLYSATYLTADSSEEIFKLLTRTDFNHGITRLLPSDLLVAHKWGVYNFPPDEHGVAYQELHDCGIVYVPNNPYLICVMTKGTDQTALSNFISNVSFLIYNKMSISL